MKLTWLCLQLLCVRVKPLFFIGESDSTSTLGGHQLEVSNHLQSHQCTLNNPTVTQLVYTEIYFLLPLAASIRSYVTQLGVSCFHRLQAFAAEVVYLFRFACSRFDPSRLYKYITPFTSSRRLDTLSHFLGIPASRNIVHRSVSTGSAFPNEAPGV